MTKFNISFSFDETVEAESESQASDIFWKMLENYMESPADYNLYIKEEG